MDGLVCHERQALTQDLDRGLEVVGHDGHDPLGAGAVRNADVGVVFGAQALNVGATLANDTAGDLARN